VRITASGYEFIAEHESQEATEEKEVQPVAKQTRWFNWPGWVNAVAAVVIAVVAVLTYFATQSNHDLPEPPEWVCSSSKHAYDFTTEAKVEVWPIVWWQDQSEDAQLKGYRVLRAAPHSIFDPRGIDAFAPISGLIPSDTPKFTDYLCPGTCGYRIVSEYFSGRQSHLSEYVHCEVAPLPPMSTATVPATNCPKHGSKESATTTWLASGAS